MCFFYAFCGLKHFMISFPKTFSSLEIQLSIKISLQLQITFLDFSLLKNLLITIPQKYKSNASLVLPNLPQLQMAIF